MSFKVQDLMTSVTPVGIEGDTCGGVTRVTGCKIDSLYALAGDRAAGPRGLSVLKAQLRKAMTRA